jgi:hypothetical protein
MKRGAKGGTPGDRAMVAVLPLTSGFPDFSITVPKHFGMKREWIQSEGVSQ